MVIYGFYETRIFQKDTVITEIPGYTSPDFKVVLGSYKLGKNSHLNKYVQKDYLFIENSSMLSNIEELENGHHFEYYYVLEGEVNGYELDQTVGSNVFVPVFRIKSVELIDKTIVLIYLIFSIISIVRTAFKVRKSFLFFKQDSIKQIQE